MPRVMWLLNHSTARKFEVKMLKQIGCTEIFLPKMFPSYPGFRSGSIDFSEDASLSIPASDLELLNQTDWYGSPSKQAWEIANRHFDILFFTLFHLETFKSTARNFQGAILWRGYGREGATSYSQVLDGLTHHSGKKLVESLGRRFWFAQAYEHLHQIEADYLATRRVYLPLGLADCEISDEWQGDDKRVFFICPDIAIGNYYKTIYAQFIQNFSDIPYVVGGAQAIPINDPNILGFVPRVVFEYHMRQLRVMFYHSSEPNHVHYHPFEAVRVGMPLVFMAGGMLDRLRGQHLPGRCKTIAEARRKIQRILQDDWKLIEDIRQSQICLLESMQPENCVPAWRDGFSRILRDLERSRVVRPSFLARRTRIAVILPIAYRGGSLRGAQLLARAIALGSKQSGSEVEVVLGYLDQPDVYSEQDFVSLSGSVKTRPYQWQILNPQESFRAMTYFGLEPLVSQPYQVPDDGIHQFMDCDLWVFISDRLEVPLLPVRPYVVMLYDYLQRHEPSVADFLNQQRYQPLNIAHAAQRVFVTTRFTLAQAIHFAGIPEHQVRLLPMLAPECPSQSWATQSQSKQRYFLWATNLGSHKNHLNALKALRIYYEELGGRLSCFVTGVDTRSLLKSELPHLKPVADLWAISSALRFHVKLLGELPDLVYQEQLTNSAFLWHPARIDNGTFSVVEAAQVGVPALSSDYPAMREIDAQFGLNLTWMNPHDPRHMARQLQAMALHVEAACARLPSHDHLASQGVVHLAGAYWEAIRECL